MDRENPAQPSESELDRKALEALVVDNPELEELEAALGQFNIFEAIGAVRQELRHSDFLAFLLNPQENHGLGDTFVKRLLQKALAGSQRSAVPIAPIDLDIWDLDEMEVRREWMDVDILLLIAEQQVAVAIENKMDSGEHSDQLARYLQLVRQHYSGWKILGLYLTPSGEEPTESTFLPVSYSHVSEIIEGLVKSRASTLGADVRTLMLDYTQMLGRHIVSESEVAKLCRQIYHKHQRAIDLIYEYRPDQQAAVRDILEQVVREVPELVLDYSTKTCVRFAPREWDVPALKCAEGWTESGRVFLFEFANNPDSLKLKLVLGPGPDETRQKLFAMVQAHEPPFKSVFKTLNEKYNTVFLRTFLTSKAYEDPTQEELEQEIRKQWAKFMSDLPSLTAVLKSERWIWGPKVN